MGPNCNPSGRGLEDWERVAAGLGVVIGSGKFWQVIGHAVAAAKGPASRLAAIVAIVPAKVKKKQAAALEEVLEGLYGLGWDVTETIPAGLREWYRGRASRSLIKALGAGPAGHEAHHIVDVMRPSADATASRKILSEYGVEVNGALNGVWLNTAAHDLTLPFDAGLRLIQSRRDAGSTQPSRFAHVARRDRDPLAVAQRTQI